MSAIQEALKNKCDLDLDEARKLLTDATAELVPIAKQIRDLEMEKWRLESDIKKVKAHVRNALRVQMANMLRPFIEELGGVDGCGKEYSCAIQLRDAIKREVA